MKTLAITGSSGSGKTTVSNLFLRLNSVLVINTDEMARDMAENDDKYLDELVLYFGNYILENSVKLNRNKLSNIIEMDDSARNELNRITKKNLMPKLDKLIMENSDKNLIIVDVPILYENGLENYFDKVLAVLSDKEEQIERICKRDEIDRYKAEARINMQFNNNFFENNADYIIYNYKKSLDELYKEVFNIYLDILK